MPLRIFFLDARGSDLHVVGIFDSEVTIESCLVDPTTGRTTIIREEEVIPSFVSRLRPKRLPPGVDTEWRYLYWKITTAADAVFDSHNGGRLFSTDQVKFRHKFCVRSLDECRLIVGDGLTMRRDPVWCRIDDGDRELRFDDRRGTKVQKCRTDVGGNFEVVFGSMDET